MSVTEQPDVVERVRMALAEAGYPNARVRAKHKPFRSTVMPRSIPFDVAWRALIIAEPVGSAPGCLACYIAANERYAEIGALPNWKCGAPREGIEDCGVSRGSD